MKQMLLASLTGLIALPVAAFAEFELTILHTNDVHARFEPISKYDSSCSAEAMFWRICAADDSSHTSTCPHQKQPAA